MNRNSTTLLVIDEDEAHVSLLRSLLGHRWDGHFRLIHVDDLASAVAVVGKEPIDAVLLDLGLQQSKGLHAFLTLYRHVPNTPIIVLSRRQDESLAVKAVQAGAQDYLVKGKVEDQLLVRSIRYAIERSGRENAEEALSVAAAQMRIAREIQRRLFPSSAPDTPGIEIAGASFPADETGGDFFDYFPLADGALAVAVGDVSSHGLGSAMLMAETRAYLRALAVAESDVGQILTLANQALILDTHGEHFVTLLLGRLCVEQRTFDYAAAGHAGFLLEPGGTVSLLASTSLPLGIEEELIVPCATTLKLRPGSTILVVTDGIHEARSPEGGMYGIDRVLDRLRKSSAASAQQVLDELFADVRSHMGSRLADDDATAVAIRVVAD